MPSTSGTRIIPAAGKRGVIAIAGDNGDIFSLFGDDWSANIEVENARIPHFNMNKDNLGQYWAAVLTGFASGSGQISAKMDLDQNSGVASSLALYLANGGSDSEATGIGIVFLGYTDLVGLICSYTMVGNNPLQGITQTAGGMYNFSFEITSLEFTTTGVSPSPF